MLAVLSVFLPLTLITPALAASPTKTQYQLVQNGSEVLFFETVVENPSTQKILQVLKNNGYNESNDLPTSAADNVWCLIESEYQNPILLVECYETHLGFGLSLQQGYDQADDYIGLPQFIAKIRETTRHLAIMKK